LFRIQRGKIQSDAEFLLDRADHLQYAEGIDDPTQKEVESVRDFDGLNPIRWIGSEYFANRNFRTLSGVTFSICVVESMGRSIRGRPKIKIIFKAVKTPVCGLI